MANKLFTRDRVKVILKGIYAEIQKMEKGREGQRKSFRRQLDLIESRLIRQ